MLTHETPWLDLMLSPAAAASALRDQPSETFIASMREQFPIEAEMDKVLTRKLRRRHLPAYQPVDLGDMQSCLEKFLEAHVDGAFSVSNSRWLAGGGSKIQLAFTLTRQHRTRSGTDAVDTHTVDTELVVRMEPPESLNTTSRLREHQLVAALAPILPVPKPYWIDEDGDWFPEPALIYEFLPGVSKPTTGASRVSGVGSDFGPELRAKLAPQFMRDLAALHTFDYRHADLSAFDEPPLGTPVAAQWQLDRARRVWEEDRGEDLPIVEVAANWLRRNAPDLDRVSVVHGDYRSGNFLFDESTGHITAWLDWERGHLGDRHRDLTWMTTGAFGHYDEEGRYLVCGLVPLDEFYKTYEQLSGLPVDEDRLRYYRVMNSYQLVVSTLGTAYRVIRLGKSHQDILLAWVEGFVRVCLKDLHDALEEVL